MLTSAIRAALADGLSTWKPHEHLMSICERVSADQDLLDPHRVESVLRQMDDDGLLEIRFIAAVGWGYQVRYRKRPPEPPPPKSVHHDWYVQRIHP